MKFYLSQISQLLEKIENGQIKALLLYGPDKGYIDKITTTLVKNFNFLKTSIEYSDLKVCSLEMIANTANFFMQKQLIKVKSVGDSLDKTLKWSLHRDDILHFPLFIADALSPSSSTRKFFESKNHLASLVCYHDDEQKVTKIILQKIRQNGKIIEEDAGKYLATALTGEDHRVIINEIDKLIYFTTEKEQITLDNAKEVINAASVGNADELCAYFSLKNLSDFLQEYIKLKQHNINEVLIIRALIRYYLNLYTVLAHVGNNMNIEIAIKTLSPPIFYKNIPNFKKAVNNLNIIECVKVLKYLQQAEIDYKSNPGGFDIYNQVYAKCT